MRLSPLRSYHRTSAVPTASQMTELAPLHPGNHTFPGEVFLHVAADALNWCGASRADPLPLRGTTRAVPARSPGHAAAE